ncbi:hypothetical protein Tco_0387776, partial [Tanacetum coccineum]
LVSAGCTMVLLVVILPAGRMVSAAMGYAAGRFIYANRVFVPAVYMVSAVG